MIAKSWQLPQELRIIIRDHHNTNHLINGLSEENDTNTMMIILKIAEHISRTHLTLGEHEIDHEWEKIKPSILEYLGFSEPDFEELEDFVYDTMGLVTA